jgi:hypothetical protein
MLVPISQIQTLVTGVETPAELLKEIAKQNIQVFTA